MLNADKTDMFKFESRLSFKDSILKLHSVSVIESITKFILGMDDVFLCIGVKLLLHILCDICEKRKQP